MTSGSSRELLALSSVWTALSFLAAWGDSFAGQRFLPLSGVWTALSLLATRFRLVGFAGGVTAWRALMVGLAGWCT